MSEPRAWNGALKMDVRTFGDLLITTRDLDPAYVGLWGANLPRPQLARWLLAYWCFYHVGVASWMSEREGWKFWEVMEVAARNESGPPVGDLQRWPRAAERRHFRGQKCVDAVTWFAAGRGKNNPEGYVLQFTQSGPWTEKQIMKEVQTWPMFGPWIAFKAADMLERVVGVQVKFDSNLGLMYDEPRAALDILVELKPFFGADENNISTGVPTEGWNREKWYNALMLHFHAKKAPPVNDRVCGPQELETVLCKWKSYMGGHYHLGKDIREHRAALAGWGSTASLMLHHMPEEVKP
jgi:hypothetical protein